MLSFIVSSVVFILWTLAIVFEYMHINTSHISLIEGATGYGAYCLVVLIVYGIYKFSSLQLSPKEVKINFWHIIGFFFLQLFLVSVFYTLGALKGSPSFFGPINFSAFTLFFHSITLLLYPTFLVFLWCATGASICYFIPQWKHFPLRLRLPIETALGLSLFSGGLMIIGFMDMYNLNGLLSLCASLTLLSFLGWREIYQNIREAQIIFPQHNTESQQLDDIIQPKLLSLEFAYIFVTFVFSVALISIIRPMPIGWDDLGVYMNFPKIMATTGELLLGAGMYTWQLITGTGFLFSNIAANAFYVNQIGGFLATISIISFLSLLYEKSGKKEYISLPMMLGVVYYIMPMTIFQQQKDMKLDPALMFVSVSAFMALWYGVKGLLKKENIRTYFLLLFIGGILTGLAFSIKFTTLMFIIAAFGLISYKFLGFLGFSGFFFLFVSIFTGGNLWGNLFVWMPEDVRSITLSTLGVAIVLFGTAFSLYKKQVNTYILSSIIFLSGIILATSPWLIKNGIETDFLSNPSIQGLLSGSGGYFSADYTTIYTPEILEQKAKSDEGAAITESGQSLNEDFSRYFGQDKGLSNYIKLPTNLTFQQNQTGEFTDITFIFLALAPVSLLFLRTTKKGKYFWLSLIGIYLFYGSIFTFNHTFNTEVTKNILENITFPLGYAILIFLIGIVLFVADKCLDHKDSKTQDALDFLMFLGIYGLIFWVSAFGIVWYGVFIYFLILVIIGYGVLGFAEEKQGPSNETRTTLSTVLSGFVGGVLLFYFLGSGIPHNWKNLTTSGYNEYKYNIMGQDMSIFAYRGDYLAPIAALNLRDPHIAVENAIKSAKTDTLKKLFTPEQTASMTIESLHTGLLQLLAFAEQKTSGTEKNALISDIQNIGDTLYGSILYPAKDNENTGKIYRIGTFMTYLINKNRERYYDDSLLMSFEKYFYDEKPETVTERMKKIGIKYLLTDLNAATIDRDPRHALTTRYEHLLLSMRSNELHLLATDNLCLNVALSDYQKGKLPDTSSFLNIAGTNYESYETDENGNETTIGRDQKMNSCARYIYDIVQKDQNIDTDYPMLVGLANQMKSAKNQSDIQNLLGAAVSQSYFALFELTDTPTETHTGNKVGNVENTGGISPEKSTEEQ